MQPVWKTDKKIIRDDKKNCCCHVWKMQMRTNQVEWEGEKWKQNKTKQFIFLIHPLSLTQATQATQGHLTLTVQHLCILRDAILLQLSPSTSSATPKPSPGKHWISLRVGSILRMCLCPHTLLAFHQKILLVRSIFLLGTAAKHCVNLLVVLNILFNSSICC